MRTTCLALSPVLTALLCAFSAGCAAAADPVAGAEPELVSAQADGELPPVAAGDGCTPATSARPLRTYALWPKTAPVALGSAVVDGRPTAITYAEGTPERESSAIVSSGFAAGPDLPNLAGWLGAPSVSADAAGAIASLTNFTDPANPLRAWGERNTTTPRRVAFAIAWNQRESDWFLADETRADAAPADAEARYVRGFGGHRYFGAAFGFDLSSCAAAKLEALLGAPPVVRRTRPGIDPTAGTLFDATRRAAIQEILVAAGAAPYVSIVSNRPRAEVRELVGGTRCSAADLGACERLVDDLQAVSKALAASPAPSTYAALTSNTGEWTVTELTAGKVAFLH